MGKAINMNRFRKLNFFQNLERPSGILQFRKRFLYEIEVKSILGQLLQREELLLQDLSYEQSFSKGFVVRIKLLCLKTAAVSTKTGQKRKELYKTGLPYFKKLPLLYNTKVGNTVTRRTRAFKKKILNFYKAEKTWQPLTVIISSPVNSFMSNKTFINYLKVAFQSLRKFQKSKNFTQMVLLHVLAFSSPGWLNLLVTIVIKSLFRSRQHAYQLRLFKSLNTTIFKHPLTTVSGTFFQLSGRLDKRPRTQKYKLFLGKIRKQTLRGLVLSKGLQAITKNGAFGVYYSIRFFG